MGANNPFLFKTAMSYGYITSLKFILESPFIKPRNHQLLASLAMPWNPQTERIKQIIVDPCESAWAAIRNLIFVQPSKGTINSKKVINWAILKNSWQNCLYCIHDLYTIPVVLSMNSHHPDSPKEFKRKQRKEQHKFDLQDLRQSESRWLATLKRWRFVRGHEKPRLMRVARRHRSFPAGIYIYMLSLWKT